MIISIGCDAIEHQEILKLRWGADLKSANRIFTENEVEIYRSAPKITFLAGRFAVKEAVLKCLGTGMEDGIPLTDIETLRSKSGKPILKIKGEVKRLADEIGIDLWHVSITHKKSSSMSFVIAERLKA
ncbi:MAG: holo-[acyl-carrier-protein] synthase [Flavobacterium sp.]|nr:MAG: holo-[acyl-carrier-protein] synthase [Flavobacterium sp.]